MSEILIQVIRDAIAVREHELEELRQKLREAEAEANGGKRRRRNRKDSGPRAGSVPALIADCLKESVKPLSAADLSERLAKHGKKIESRFIAAAISRYVKAGRIFSQTPEGLYELRR